ncbi:MAG: hypothetical protein RLZZ628_3134 [Bacteroidota bacterium]|jgi:hypothetical protein
MDRRKEETKPSGKPQYWRLWLLIIVFLFLEAFIICIVGPEMKCKENPNCCPPVKSWHDIWIY